MPLGGSVTRGVGSADRNGYREELVKLLVANKYCVEMTGTCNTGSMLKNAHEGWSGLRIDEIESQARKCLSKLLPDVFAVNAGSNDCLQNFELSLVKGRMDSLLEYLWTARPGSTVILSTLIVNRDRDVNSRIIAVNELYRGLVNEKAAQQKRIVLADMFTSEGPSVEDLGGDGTHPGSSGYRKMACILYRAIEEAAEREFFGQG